MIVLRLKGNLGNQLFDFSIAYKLSKLLNTDIALDDQRKNSLLDFYNLPCRIATEDEKKICLKNKIGEKIDFNNLEENIYLDGFYQNIDYFDIEHIKNLQKIFNIPIESKLNKNDIEIVQDINKSLCSVSINIRRGDYVNSRITPLFGLCSQDYYENALRLISEKNEKIDIFLSTDDTVWLNKHLNIFKKYSNKLVIVNNCVDRIEKIIYILSKCKNNILCNSSISWWSALLNENTSRMIIAPIPWFDHLNMNLYFNDYICLPKNSTFENKTNYETAKIHFFNTLRKSIVEMPYENIFTFHNSVICANSIGGGRLWHSSSDDCELLCQKIDKYICLKPKYSNKYIYRIYQDGTFTLKDEPTLFDILIHKSNTFNILLNDGMYLSANRNGNFGFAEKPDTWELFFSMKP